MDREEWMYKLLRVGNDQSLLHHVRNFVAAVKKDCVSLGRGRTICPCNSCKNKLLKEDNVVLTWFAMVLSRITQSRNFTVKQIRVSPVHLNEPLRRPHSWMKEDNNPRHQQQQRAMIMRIAITSASMIFPKTWEAIMVVGMVSRVIFWDPKMHRFLKILLTIWTKMIFYLGIRSGWRISKRWSRQQLIRCIRIVRNIGRCCVLTSSCWCWSLAMGGPTLASTTCYVCLLTHTQPEG